jgi:hypothetical protein
MIRTLGGGDVITDFNAAQGDVLDLSALLDGISVDNVQFESTGPGNNDIAVSVDQNGGADSFAVAVTLIDPSGVTQVQEAAAAAAVVA